MKKTAALFLIAILAFSLFAALMPTRGMRGRVPGLTFTHLTNSATVCGVKMPPRYTAELWARSLELQERFHAEMKELDRLADKEYEKALNDEQRKALAKAAADAEREYGERQAREKARYDELVAITNRASFVKKAWHEKRRSEYEFHEGLYWLGEKVEKECVTRAENGKQVVHILYTRGKDGKEKRHRYDPDTIVKSLEAPKAENKKGVRK